MIELKYKCPNCKKQNEVDRLDIKTEDELGEQDLEYECEHCKTLLCISVVYELNIKIDSVNKAEVYND